ncbi:MAG: hypothetical protein Q9M82_04525 [Mariprofundus sp.]|nr:hypothetical protein [Mariprofundus sp.]
MQELRQSRTILIQMLLATLALAGLSIYLSDTLVMIYFSNQQTSVGYVLNGFILVLFLLGIIRALMLLFTYQREEAALSRCLSNLDQQQGSLLQGVAPASIIAVRVGILENMRVQRAPVHHQALAATLLARESVRTGLVRFIHNILILCGVLGTIVSLSIALFGASSLLEQAVSSNGMGMVIHGMSTALSTTMTAILCYLFLTYFLSAIQNLQTCFLGHVEEITATRLLPLYQITEDAVTEHALDLVREAHLLVQSLHDKIDAIDPDSVRLEVEQSRAQAQVQHEEMLAQVQHQQMLAQVQHEQMLAQLRELSAIMKDGFRLPGA